MSTLESDLKAVRDRAIALTSGQRLRLGTQQSLAGLSNVTRGSLGLSGVGIRKTFNTAGNATRSTGAAAWSGAKKIGGQAYSKEVELAADARRLTDEYRHRAADAFPLQISNPTVVSGLQRTGLADALPEQVATIKPSRRRLKIALIAVGVVAAGAAVFAISRRRRPAPPSVAAAPPRLTDVPVAEDEAPVTAPASPSSNGQTGS
ncbi:hypothetical protein [Nocardia sp. 348MFTsu5.1]|jgi:hypothetical protein|uniref:hypothetical protein n=1 Tax=Nocardia sp. 348MFTsu5.1 TaxID=1172185 RepID=UPI0003768A6D|nr:hypothetical protein [Nocardia sp. 348MFTsu5.1]